MTSALALFAAATPVLADHGIGHVTPATRCEVELSTDRNRNVVATGTLVEPPSTVVVLQFSSRVEPLNFESWHRGTHARIDIDFSTPPEIGETWFPVVFGSGGVIGGYDFRFRFKASSVMPLSVTGAMEAGPECHDTLLPDTSTDQPQLQSHGSSPLFVLVAGLVGAIVWWSRRFLLTAGDA